MAAPGNSVMLSSLLRKQLSSFLNIVGMQQCAALCLTDDALAPLVWTQSFPKEVLQRQTLPAERRLKQSGNQRPPLRLFAVPVGDRPDGQGLTGVLELAAEGLQHFLKNEAEIQKLSEELLERYQELHVLYDVIDDVSAVFDENEICRIILSKAVNSIGVDFGMVVLKGDAGEEVRCKESNRQGTRAYNEDDGRSCVRDVIATGKHIVLERKSEAIPSVLAVPIKVESATIGAVLLMAKLDEEMFTSGDRISLTALAGYLGVAVNTARLVAEARDVERLRNEIEFARQIQQSLLPDRVPTFARLDAAAACLPSERVGGDLFGFVRLDARTWAMTVADVAGHGLGAAFIMASLRSILRSEAKPGISAANILKNSNNLLNEDTQKNDVFATVFMGVYSEETNSINYSNAGHPPGLLWKAGEGRFCDLDRGGVVLGLFENETYEEDTVRLDPGDVFVLYTDGIPEAKRDDGVMYEQHRLREAIRTHAAMPAGDILKAILESVEFFRDGARQRDDVTILVFKSR